MSHLEVIDTWLITTSLVTEQQGKKMEESHEPRPSCVQKRKALMYILSLNS